MARLAADLRRARVAAGLSLRAVGTSAGVDHSTIWRFESGRPTSIRLRDLAAVGAVLGMDVVVRAYPAGDPIRDVAHSRLLARLRSELHPSLRWHSEVPFPNPGDLRAWDAVVATQVWRCAIEAETVIDDTQALDRKLALKQRDGGVGHLILLVADTPRNRRAIAAAPAAFAALPLRTRQILGALRDGRDPGGSGIVIM